MRKATKQAVKDYIALTIIATGIASSVILALCAAVF